MNLITLEAQNSRDWPSEKLDPLLATIRAQFPDYDVQGCPREITGLGVTWWEVLYVWLPSLAQTATIALVTEIVRLFVEWARKRMEKEGEKPRPKYVAILGPDGKVLKSVLVKNATPELEDRTAQDQERPPRKFPGA